MKRIASVFIPWALLMFTASPAIADDMHMNMSMDGKATVGEHRGTGKINSVDAKSGKINITHEPIASLNWPAMTMDFEVQDKALLAKLKKGQKVEFKLTEARKGKYVVNEIIPVK